MPKASKYAACGGLRGLKLGQLQWQCDFIVGLADKEY